LGGTKTVASRAKWREGRQLFLLATCGQAAQKLRDQRACNILAGSRQILNIRR
jgi:hypothetical protein